MAEVQRPIELIMARSLMESLSTPAFLVDQEGVLVFYNDAAAELLGVSFREAGRMEPNDWGTRFGPFTSQGRPIPVEDLPLTVALRSGRPAHSALRIRAETGEEHDIEATAFPILGNAGSRGAIAVFWPIEEGA